MIGKIIKGRSFKGCISYVMEKKESRLLEGEGVLLTDKKSIINSFYLQSRMNPKLTRCVGHIPLSYSPHDKERMTDEFMTKLAKEYMKAMKIENTQYIIVRHEDRDHPHCHIIFNRIDNNGKTISEKNDYARNERVTKSIKERYGLYFGKGKEQVHTHHLQEPDKTRYEIHAKIRQVLPSVRSWQELEQQLKASGIEISYRYKGESTQIQGITFLKNGYAFKGSEVDRCFSYGKLAQTFLKNKQAAVASDYLTHGKQPRKSFYKRNKL